MRILAIETSCDDTSLALVSYDGKVWSCDCMTSFSQIETHIQYGWVVPELASREHLNQILLVLQGLLSTAWYENLEQLMNTIDAIAVTDYPWLPWSLIIWRTLALFLSQWYDKIYIPVNHLHGHIFSFLLSRSQSLIDKTTTLVLSISWWHSDLSLLSNVDIRSVNVEIIWQYMIKKIWSTRDDAIWEVFDKVSRLLWGPYPWGIWIGQRASLHSWLSEQFPFPIIFKRIQLDGWNYDFSFSGMKSQAHTFIEKYKQLLLLSDDDCLPDNIINYIAYEFEQAATDILIKRITLVLENDPSITNLAVVWWVSANIQLRKKLSSLWEKYNNDYTRSLDIYTPISFDYCTDNAAMIGMAGIISLIER